MASCPTPASDRRYRGSSAEERRAQRREQLIRAAIQVYGERGYRNATVKAVCEAAGLTERYFYESFANSEALLVASFNAVTRFLLDEIEQVGIAAGGDGVERVRAMLGAYYEALKRDPPSARVFLVEIGGVSPAVDQALADSLRAFGELLHRALSLGRQTTRADESLLRTGVIGGVIHIALDWIASGYSHPVSEVVSAALRLCLVLSPAGAKPPVAVGHR